MQIIKQIKNKNNWLGLLTYLCRHNFSIQTCIPKLNCKYYHDCHNKNNLSAVLHGVKDLRLEHRPIPEINSNEVLLEMDSVGICGSDFSYFHHEKCSNLIRSKPMVIGHEGAGVVCDVGKDVKNLKCGDRVAIEPGIPCRVCSYCKIGKFNLCTELKFCASPPYDGNLAKFYKHAAEYCYKLPDHVTMEEGALLETISLGMHACRQANVSVGSEVLILGAGPVGLATLLIAQAMGASTILLADIDHRRLNVARQMSASHTLCICKEIHENDVITEIHSLMGSTPEKTIDCVGAESSNRLAVLATRPGGCAVLVGLGPIECNLPLFETTTREIDIRGVFRYCDEFLPALKLVSSGQVNPKHLVSHHFNLTECCEAYDLACYGCNGTIEIMIHCQPRDKNNKTKFCT